MLPGEAFFKFGNEVRQRDAEVLADHLELDDINAALATFDLADAWLRKGKLLPKLGLRQPCPMADFNQKLQKDGVIPCMDAFAHHVHRMMNSKVE